MARTSLAPLTFGIVYLTERLAPVSVDVIEARDYWAACKAGWKEVGRRKRRMTATDFVLVEDPAAIDGGPQHIRAAAVAILAARDESRKAAA